jgi:cysteinyl-tRNA synthetase
MSKSSGGFLTLQSLVDSGYDPLDYRCLLLGGHYRSQLQFSFEALDGARNTRRAILDKVRALSAAAKNPPAGELSAGFSGESSDGNVDTASAEAVSAGAVSAHLAAFTAAMEDDLATPRAMAELWGLLRDNSIAPAGALRAAAAMDGILGLGLLREPEQAGESPECAAEIEALVAKRAEAKKAKNFAEADAIRNSLKERGIILEDGKAGTVWRRG